MSFTIAYLADRPEAVPQIARWWFDEWALATKVVEIAKSQGIDALHLQTESLNGGLYAKLGWERIEQVHHYMGYDAVVMVKRL